MSSSSLQRFTFSSLILSLKQRQGSPQHPSQISAMIASQPSSACRSKSACLARASGDGEGGDSTGVARAVAAATGRATKTNLKSGISLIFFIKFKFMNFFVKKEIYS